MRQGWRFLWALSLLPLAVTTAGAAPQVERFFPPGLQRGTQCEIVVEGTLENWPVKAWISTPGVEIEPQEEKGKLLVTVADSVSPGLCWVRLLDQTGVSSLRPLVIGLLPEICADEPGQAADREVPQPIVVNGRLATSGEVDTFQVSLQAGQQLVASLEAHSRLGSPMDAVLQVCDSDGFVLAQSDDAVGIDPLIVHRAPQAGRYLVRLFAFPETPNSTIGFSGSKAMVYRLTLTSHGFLDHCLPMAVAADGETKLELRGWGIDASQQTLTLHAPPDVETSPVFLPGVASWVEVPVSKDRLYVADQTHGSANPLGVAIPALISGTIETSGDEDSVEFDGKKGQSIAARVEAARLNFLLDPYLALYDAAGKQLAANDDAEQSDSALTFTLPADGRYQLRIRDVFFNGGERYVYRMQLGEATPDFALSLAQEHVVLEPGKEQEIAVTIERRNGYEGEIDVIAEGLPEGIQSAVVRSPGTGDAAKKVSVKLQAAAAVAPVAIRIIGQSLDGKLTRRATFVTQRPQTRHHDLLVFVKET